MRKRYELQGSRIGIVNSNERVKEAHFNIIYSENIKELV